MIPKPPTQSLMTVESLRYTLADVHDKKDPADFVQQMVVHGKNSGLAITEPQQARLAYTHFDAVLRITLNEPGENTTLARADSPVCER